MYQVSLGIGMLTECILSTLLIHVLGSLQEHCQMVTVSNWRYTRCHINPNRMCSSQVNIIASLSIQMFVCVGVHECKGLLT